MDFAWIAWRLRQGARVQQRLADEQAGQLLRAGQALAAALLRGDKVLAFGNGGSAAEAQHFAAELVGRFQRERYPLPALALTADTSALTAIGNDYGFDQVFARQVRALGRPGDVAVAISTSGRSPNVLAAVEAASERGLTTIGLTGGEGQPLAGKVDIPILVPSANTARVQESHLAVIHLLCEWVDAVTSTEPDALASFAPPGPSASGMRSPKVTEWELLLALRQRWRAEGTVVVWTNGCFDLVHAGHVRSLQAARALGEVLVVGINSDESVRQLKGPNRPVVSIEQRVEVVAALECVDYVTVFHELTPEAPLARLQPDIHCKGADYAPPHGKPIPEKAVVEAYGGRVEFLPLVPATATSDLIRRIRESEGAPESAKSGEAQSARHSLIEPRRCDGS